MECPRCHNEMTAELYEGETIYRCSVCKGVWVPGERLAVIVEKRDVDFSKQIQAVKDEIHNVMDIRELEPDVSCPQCGAKCRKVNYAYSSGIIVDHCPNGCGIWLDNGELDRIQVFVEFWDNEAVKVMEEKGLYDIFEEDEDKGEENENVFDKLKKLFYWL